MVRLRLVFLGTPSFAAAALERLFRSSHTVAGVVTQPDRPRGRGQKLSAAPVKEFALARGVPVLQPERLKTSEFRGQLADVHPDLGVVAAYGRILPDDIIAVPRLGMINIHASILPRYRGAAPVHRAVIAGETETGVSIMRVVRELDAGGVFAIARRPIGPDETSVDVERGLAAIGAELCAQVIDDLAAGTARETPQDDARATYAPRLTKEEGIIDWRQPAAALHNLVRGLHSWPHAQARISGTRLLILRTAVVSDPPRSRTPGEILEAHGDDLIVAAGEAALKLVQVQPEGRRAMRAREFLAGRRLRPGDAFDRAPEPAR